MRDDLERVDLLDNNVTGDIFELNVVHECFDFPPENDAVSLAVSFAPHEGSLRTIRYQPSLSSTKYLKLGELVRLQALSSQDPLYHRLGYLHDGPELEEIVTESIHEVQDLVLK